MAIADAHKRRHWSPGGACSLHPPCVPASTTAMMLYVHRKTVVMSVTSSARLMLGSCATSMRQRPAMNVQP